jgi:hypothetical protein
MIAAVMTFGEEARHRFEIVRLSGKLLFDYLGNIIGTWINATVQQFAYLGEVAKAVWATIKNPLGGFQMPDISPYTSALKDFGNALIGKDAMGNALKGVTEEVHKHAARVKQIDDDLKKALAANNEKRVEDEIKAGEKIVVAKVNNDARIAELKKKRDALLAEEAVAKQDRADKAIIDGLEAQIKALDEIIDRTKELAGMAPDAVVAQQKAQAEADKQGMAAFEKQKKLEDMAGKGIRLTRRDQDWLAAARAIDQAARDQVAAEMKRGQLDAALKARQEKDSKNLDKMQASLSEIERELVPLIMQK